MNEESILKSLKIIGKIMAGGRLCVYSDGTFALEADSKWITIKRFIKGDSRFHCVKAISNVIKGACELARFYENHRFMDISLIKESIVNDNSEMIITEHKSLVEKLNKIKYNLLCSREGIINLKNTTYVDDAEIYVMLEIIIGDIDNKVIEIDNKLSKIQ